MDRQRLEDSILHSTIFRQHHPNDNRSIYLVFKRLNTGGSLMTPQEIRCCMYCGKFISLLGDINEDPNWRAIFGPINRRQEDQELILRFLAFLHNSKYRKPMRDFLTFFLHSHQDLDQERAREFKDEFAQTLQIIRQSVGDRAYRLTGRLNAAIFDSVSVGIAKRLQTGPVCDLSQVKKAYLNLIPH